MRKIMYFLTIMAFVFVGLISSRTILAVSSDSITEGEEWNGKVEGTKELKFIPEETGFYNVRIKDSEADNTYMMVSFKTEDDELIMDSISEYGDTDVLEVYKRNAVYLLKDKEYNIIVKCSDLNDDADDEVLMDGNVSLTIEKSSDEVIKLAVNYKKTAKAFYRGNSICSYTPDESGAYSFYFGLKDGSTWGDIDLYVMANQKLKKISERSLSSSYYGATSFQLEAEKEYYFVVETYGNYDTEEEKEDGSESDAWCSLTKLGTIVSIELEEEPLLSTFDSGVWLSGSGSLKVNYADGSSESIEISHMNATREIKAEYLGERDKDDYFVSGRQKVKFVYLDTFECTATVNVLSKVQYAEREYGVLQIGKEVEVEPAGWYYTLYKFTPTENGYYTWWFKKPSMSEWYDSWSGQIFDSNDNEVEFVSGLGWKLQANKDYCFEFYLSGNKTENTFTYWLGINTDHVHTYGTWTTTVPATITSTGVEERVCTDCGAVETRSLDKLTVSNSNENNSQQTSGTAASNNTSGTKDTSSQSGKTDNAVVEKLDNDNSTGALLKPIVKSVKQSGKGKIAVKWKKVENGKAYQVQYSTSKKFKTKKTKTTTKTSLTIKKLKKKMVYFVRVRAYKIVNGKRVYSSWSATKKIKIKK